MMGHTHLAVLEPFMHRRSFLRSTALAAGVAALGPSFWRTAYASSSKPGSGWYGGLRPADGNGVRLPEGFTSRVLAVTDDRVAGTGWDWHRLPDGGAVFPQPDGGWVYTSNSEADDGKGGVSAMRFDAAGEVTDAYPILDGTSRNCAGGPSPWGTWLSCEEFDEGLVWECRVDRPSQGVALPALGRFKHEAVTFDAERGQVYLTEDESDGRFYRFTPAAWPSLNHGALEALAVDDEGKVSWVPIPEPDEPQKHARPPGTAAFDGGEGVWFDAGHVYFTTKGDNRVWDLDVSAQRLAVLYDAQVLGSDAPLTGVDNLVVSRSGDIFVAEDGGNMEIVVITTDREVAPVVKVKGHSGSEITGPAFSPDGSRLYFSSQNGADGRGVTYEVAGPFRTSRPDAAADEPSSPFDGLGDQWVATGAAVAAAAAAAAGAAVWARRRSEHEAERGGPPSESPPRPDPPGE